MTSSLLADGEGVADDLVAGADREHGGSAVDRPVQAAVGLQRADGRDLGGVLTAAEQVDVAGVGQRIARLDHGQHRVEPAPGEPLDQHGGVAAVAVDAEQRLVDQDDLDPLADAIRRRPSCAAAGTACTSRSRRPARGGRRAPRPGRECSGARPRRSSAGRRGPGPAGRWRPPCVRPAARTSTSQSQDTSRPSAAAESMASTTVGVWASGRASAQPAGFLASSSRAVVSPKWAVANRPAGCASPSACRRTRCRGSTPISSAAASAQAALLTLKAPGTLSSGSQTCCRRSMIVPSTTR